MPWPAAIQPDIRSPFSILEQEAQGLKPQTRGILVAEVTADAPEGENGIRLHLDIIVPALNNYRRRILTAIYDKTRLYPVTVDADCFRPRSAAEGLSASAGSLFSLPAYDSATNGPQRHRENLAATDEDLARLVDKVLNSDEVKSLAVSLIALANERLKGPRINGAANATAVEASFSQGRQPASDRVD